MSAQLLSFTTEVTPRQLERGMVKAVLAVLEDAQASDDTASERRAAFQRVQSMAAAYADLTAQLGIATPESIERWIEKLDALDRLIAL